MNQLIVYIDRSTIQPANLEEVTRAVAALVQFVETHEPQLISYGFYIDEGSSTMSVVAVHPDSASLEFHLEIGGPEFRKMAEFIDLQRIDVYGRPSTKVLEQLEQKAHMLGEHGRVAVHAFEAGFARYSPTDS